MIRISDQHNKKTDCGGRKLRPAAAVACGLVMAASMITGGCNPAPEGVLSPEEMAQLLADIHTGESVSSTERRTFSNDSIKRLLKQSILMKHGLTTEEFDSSLMWYGQHIDTYTKVYDRVIEILEDRIDELEKDGAYNANDDGSNMLSGIEFDGDSVDVWTSQRSAILSEHSPSTVIPFHLVSDQNWERGDRYVLSMTTHGLNGPLNVNIAVEYFDGSVDYASSMYVGDGARSLKLPLDSTKNAHYVFGNIILQPQPGNKVYMDSISLYRVRMAPYNAGQKINVKSIKRTRP